MTLSEWLLLGGITLLAYFIKGISGFGNTVIMSPLYVQILPPTIVTPIDLLFSIPTNIFIYYKNHKHVVVKQLLPVIALMAIGAVPGALLLKFMNVELFKALLGLLIVGIAIDRVHHKYMKHGKLNKRLWLKLVLGIFSGLTVGMFGIGLPIAAYLTRTSESVKAFKGQITFIFLCENLFRLFLYIGLGLITLEVFKYVLYLCPFVALGLYFGHLLSRKVKDVFTDVVIVALLVVIGTNMFLSNTLNLFTS
jgi:uncharacterized membrane protein YfcA